MTIIYCLFGIVVLCILALIVTVIVLTGIITRQARNLMWFSGNPGRMIAQYEVGLAEIERDREISNNAARAAEARSRTPIAKQSFVEQQPRTGTIPSG